ncbi:hypothetical protein WJX73_009504 [Symbiochloris irregularis]|uniref:AAA+ ATPase domain-containing protein n=1 Tax=Symbiochloris irregularis TaxID=706552 RepID=A0AAW1NMZ2_9CHLO
MPAPLLAAGATVAVAGIIATLFAGSDTFVDRPCEDFESYLSSQLVGQPLALQQFSDAVCDHLAKDVSTKPLVVSFHGPPGVGKSLMHSLAARALYNQKPEGALQCPGKDCAGYKVLYGLDYTATERQQQYLKLQEALVQHVRHHPNSLLVIEEYDKLDCPTRGMFRQLLENPQVFNISLGGSIVLMESNMGYDQLYQLEQEALRSGTTVQPEAASKVLKDLVFSVWREGGCEGFTDTAKSVSLINFYLPFFPLRRPHIAQLFEMKLRQRSQALALQGLPELRWQQKVVEFLTAKVDFEGEHPVEGAKEIARGGQKLEVV